MPTKNLVPRANGEGKLGIKGASNLTWKEVNAVSGSFDELSNSAGNDLIAAGSGITITKISTSGSQYEISSSGATINSINDISDVDTATVAPTDGQALVWSNTDSEWQPGTISATQFSNWSDVNGSIIPDTNSAYDIGSAELKVQHLYLSSNSLHIGSTPTESYTLSKNLNSDLVWNKNGVESVLATEASVSNRLTNYATTDYVNDTLQGLDAKESVVAATTGALSGYTYINNVFTDGGTTGALSIDGHNLSNNDRILVKDQVDAIENGIYSVSNIGGSSVTLTRVSDLTNADQDADDFDGAFVFVQNGTTNAGRSYVAKPTTLGETTVGTHAMSWVTFTSSTVTSLDNLSDVTYSSGELTFADLDILNLPDSGSISNGVLDLKNAGAAVSSIKLYCESNNAHFTELKSAPHGNYSGNVSFTLPATVGTPGQVLQTDGSSGVLTWVDAAAGGANSLDDLADVTLDTVNGPTVGNGLVYNNSQWVENKIVHLPDFVGNNDPTYTWNHSTQVPDHQIEYHTRLNITGTASNYFSFIIPDPSQSILGRIFEINFNASSAQNPTLIYTNASNLISPFTTDFVDDGNLSNIYYTIPNYYNVKFKVIFNGSEYLWQNIYRAPISQPIPDYSSIGILNTSVSTSDTGTDGNINFTTDGTSRWDVTSDGHLIPATHNTYNIGASNQRLNTIYSDDIYIGGSSYFTYDTAPISGNYGITLRSNPSVSSAPSLKLFHSSNNTNTPRFCINKQYAVAGHDIGIINFGTTTNATTGLIINKFDSQSADIARLDFSVKSAATAANDSTTVGLSIVGRTSLERPVVRIADAFNLPTTDGNSNQILQTDGAGNLSWINTPSSGITSVSQDSAPQLGGFLDVNNNPITNNGSNGHINLEPKGSGHVLIGAEGAKSSPPELRFFDENATYSVGLKGPDVSKASQNITFELPAELGASGQVLSTSGSGVLTWTTPSSGGSSTIPDVVVVTATTTASFATSGSNGDNERIYLVDNGSTAVTIKMPTFSGNSGKKFQVKRLGTADVTIAVQGGEKLETATDGTFVISSQFSSVTLVCSETGTSLDGWYII